MLIEAHLICIALVLVDIVARTWRIQWILRGLRFKVPFGEALSLNVVGDAASAVTPLRIGGEPARMAALAHARVPLTAGFVAITIELILMWPIVLAAGGWLALIYAPSWWRTAGPELAQEIAKAWPWVVVVIVLSFSAWWAARHLFPRASHVVRRSTRRALVYARRMPTWPLLAGLLLTLVSLAARLAILPVLALTLPERPPLGPLTFGSFTLLYSQFLLPTPSGAGVVDLGFLGGAAGDLQEHEAALLVAWRFYTTFVLVALGLILAVRQYGGSVVAAILRGRTPPGVSAPAELERDARA
jgi:uncharacterized membrane protein YbhN (UPF0104 family)